MWSSAYFFFTQKNVKMHRQMYISGFPENLMGLFWAFQDSGFVPYPKFSIGFYVFLPLLYFFWISFSFSSTAILLFRSGLIAHSYQMGAPAMFWVEWRAWIRDFDWPLQGRYTVESWLDRSKGKAGNPVRGLQQVKAIEKMTVVWTRVVETAIDRLIKILWK